MLEAGGRQRGRGEARRGCASLLLSGAGAAAEGGEDTSAGYFPPAQRAAAQETGSGGGRGQRQRLQLPASPSSCRGAGGIKGTVNAAGLLCGGCEPAVSVVFKNFFIDFLHTGSGASGAIIHQRGRGERMTRRC